MAPPRNSQRRAPGVAGRPGQGGGGAGRTPHWPGARLSSPWPLRQRHTIATAPNRPAGPSSRPPRARPGPCTLAQGWPQQWAGCWGGEQRLRGSWRSSWSRCRAWARPRSPVARSRGRLRSCSATRSWRSIHTTPRPSRRVRRRGGAPGRCAHAGAQLRRRRLRCCARVPAPAARRPPTRRANPPAGLVHARRCNASGAACGDILYESTGAPPAAAAAAHASPFARPPGQRRRSTPDPPPHPPPHPAPRHLRAVRGAHCRPADRRRARAPAAGARVLRGGAGPAQRQPAPAHVAGAHGLLLLRAGAHRGRRRGRGRGRRGLAGAPPAARTGRPARAPAFAPFARRPPTRRPSPHPQDLSRQGSFRTPLRDGWGAANDGPYVVLSDGSSTLTWADPARGWARVKSVPVRWGSRAVRNLNEVGRPRARRTPAAPRMRRRAQRAVCSSCVCSTRAPPSPPPPRPRSSK